jgi:putative transposase
MESDKNVPTGKIIQVDERLVQDKLSEIVRGTVEETLNAMLDAEADRLCNAERYEHTEARKDTRAGYYERGFETKAGKVRLKIPKLRTMTFETAIIERYKRRESSVEEALIEMYLAGVSVRRVEDITQALWGTKVSAGTISELNKQVYEKINEWRNKPITQEYPYVYLDGTVLKKTWGGEVRNISILIAIGVSSDGFRHVLGVVEGMKEDKSGWSNFLKHLRERGLKGVRLFITDKCLGLVESIEEYFPDSAWQRCIVHFYRNVFSVVPHKVVKEVAAMLKAIHAQENREECIKKGGEVAKKLEGMRLKKAAETVSTGLLETLSYTEFPREHWIRLRTNNPLERINKEIKRRTKVVGCFPDGESALMLAAARLRHVMGTNWSSKRYLNIDLLREQDLEKEASIA